MLEQCMHVAREYLNRSPVAEGDQMFILAIPKKGIGERLATGYFPVCNLGWQSLARVSLIKIHAPV